MTTIGGSTLSLRLSELRQKEGVLAKAALGLLILLGAALFFVWTRSAVIELSRDMSKLKREEYLAIRRNQILTIEKNSLSQVERIRKYATEQLGMASPDPRRIREIEVR